MILTSIVFSFLFAIIFAILLAYAFNRRGPGPANGIIFVFTIIFLFSWAIGGWLTPMGPIHWGASWLGYLLMALFVALLLGALLPPARPKPGIKEAAASDEDMFQKKADKYPMEIGLGIFFWLMVIALLSFAIVKLFF